MKLAINRDKDRLLTNLVVFVAIYCSHDTLLFGTNSSGIMQTIKYMVPVFVVLFCLLFQKLKLTKKDVILVLVFEALPLVSCAINAEAINNYIYRFFIILAGFILIKTFSFDSLRQSFSKIMYFLCVYSLIVMAIFYVAPNILRTLPVITNTLGVSYFNALFCLGQFETILGIWRNFGIFREPGVYAIFVNLALLNEIFNTKLNIKHILIFLITLVTTFSTAGYIAFAVILVFYVLYKKDRHKFLYMTLAIVLMASLAIFTDFSDNVLTMFSKFKKGSNAYGSFYARLMSVWANIEICLGHPIFGIGRYHLYDTNLGVLGNYSATDNTNTLLINFASFGLIYGLMHFVGLFSFSRNICKKDIWKSCFIVLILILMFSNEDMNQNVIYYVIIFLGMNISKKYESS